MAFETFLTETRGIRDGLYQHLLEFSKTKPRVRSTTLLEVAARMADVWFRPDLVAGYDEADFPFVKPAEREELTHAVGEFRQLTAAARSRPPAAEEVARGFHLFERIHDIPAPYFEEYALHQLADATLAVGWPDFVRGVQYELRNDWTGEPSIYIWLVLKDKVSIESSLARDDFNRARDAYRYSLRHAGITRWPYISIRSRSVADDRVGARSLSGGAA